MGCRSEQRIAVSCPVVVRGFDSGGRSFTLKTETEDISLSGASLKGLTGTVTAGMKIEIESKGQKSWYRVQWVGQAGSARAGRVGVRCLEQGKYIWGVAPKEWQPDTYDPSKPTSSATKSAAPGLSYDTSAAPSWAGQERRQFARHPCQIQAEVTIAGESTGVAGRITDISLGGCYVEMYSPFPVDTEMRLALQLEDRTAELSGRVRSSQTGCGMGVAFTAMSAENFEMLRHLAPPAANTAGFAKSSAQAGGSTRAMPTAVSAGGSAYASSTVISESYSEVDSLDLPPGIEALEAVVGVLLRKGLITRAELAEELEKLKIPKA
jgi:PilZ domain